MSPPYPAPGAAAKTGKPARMPLRAVLLAAGRSLPANMVMGNHAFIREWTARRARTLRLRRPL